MDTRKFIKESPFGLGWLFGHLSLPEAVKLTAKYRCTSVAIVCDTYGIDLIKEDT